MDYQAQYASERARIYAALSEIPAGGVIEDCQHVGATRLLGQGGCVDSALALYPLDGTLDTKMAVLGYQVQLQFQYNAVKLYRHASEAYQVWAIESGDEAWGKWAFTTDYFAHDADARREYAEARAVWVGEPRAKAEFFERAWRDAERWWVGHYGFSPLAQVQAELAGMGAPWRMVGGWALDLYLGQVGRVHHDFDIEIAYADQMIVREHLTARGWKFVTPQEGHFDLWLPSMRLEPPRHQAHAHREGAFLDFLLSDIREGIWRYRREPVIVRALASMAMETDDGIPYLAPEVCLLFKSRNTSNKDRSKDQVDFDRVLPRLEPERRAWLRWALLVTNPAHPWVPALT